MAKSNDKCISFRKSSRVRCTAMTCPTAGLTTLVSTSSFASASSTSFIPSTLIPKACNMATGLTSECLIMVPKVSPGFNSCTIGYPGTFCFRHNILFGTHDTAWNEMVMSGCFSLSNCCVCRAKLM